MTLFVKVACACPSLAEDELGLDKDKAAWLAGITSPEAKAAHIAGV